MALLRYNQLLEELRRKIMSKFLLEQLDKRFEELEEKKVCSTWTRRRGRRD